MRDDETEAQAAEYVLGTLDAEDRRRFARDLARDPVLQEITEGWERRLGPLAEALEPVAPPAALWDRIDAALNQRPEAVPFGTTVRADEGQWSRLAKGVDKKVLLRDREAGIESYLLRMAPGSRLPAHRHRITEECLVLEGELSIGGFRFAAGDFHAITPDEQHPEIFSAAGALVFIRGEPNVSLI